MKDINEQKTKKPAKLSNVGSQTPNMRNVGFCDKIK